jgi:acyl carrier protein
MASSFDLIAQKLAEQLDIDVDTISVDSDIFDDLGADSLDAVELIMALEDEFGLTIDPDDTEQLLTVGEVADLIDRLIGQA